MVFYHATNALIYTIDLSKSRNRLDFGKGFYLTNKLGTAYDWAIRKVELESEGIPTVLSYNINEELYSIPGLKFSNLPNQEWLDFICMNRHIDPHSNNYREPRHDYNWVSGPIADDKVVDVVAEFMRNEVTSDIAIKRLCALPQTYQLSLHTPEAIDFINEFNVSYKQLTRGRWTQSWRKRLINN